MCALPSTRWPRSRRVPDFTPAATSRASSHVPQSRRGAGGKDASEQERGDGICARSATPCPRRTGGVRNSKDWFPDVATQLGSDDTSLQTFPAHGATAPDSDRDSDEAHNLSADELMLSRSRDEKMVESQPRSESYAHGAVGCTTNLEADCSSISRSAEDSHGYLLPRGPKNLAEDKTCTVRDGFNVACASHLPSIYDVRCNIRSRVKKMLLPTESCTVRRAGHEEYITLRYNTPRD